MYNQPIPSRADLPGTAQLNRATLLALVTALVILFTVVLPAEYAIDPTGLGRLTGLVDMGEIKQQLAEEAAADAVAATTAASASGGAVAARPVFIAPAAQQDMADTGTVDEPGNLVVAATPAWRDEVRLTLTPGQGSEWKLVMSEGSVARFAWVSNGGPINYDTHGDGNGRSISYEKGRGVLEDEGSIEAVFDGNHGWFFRNRNRSDVTVILRTDGDYKALKRVL